MKAAEEWSEFCSIGHDVCGGLIFDKKGNMLVARQKGLEIVTSDGKAAPLYDFSEIVKDDTHNIRDTIKDYYFKSPFIWDMKYDKDNNILAAAQDRILKISEDGRVSTLIREDFDGFLGASGIELDREGNLYVVSGAKVYKYSGNLNKTEFISSDDYQSFFSIAFSPDYKYLYLTDFFTKALIKYEINSDGSIGNCHEIIREAVVNSEAFGAPLNMIFDKEGSMYVSIDGMAHILRIDKEGYLCLFDMLKPVRNHIIMFGNELFGEEYIYFTTYGDKVCRIKLENRNF